MIPIMKITNFNFKLFLIFLTAIAFTLSGCGDQPLFDELATNRLTVKIKGTYESNGPTRDWEWPADPEDDSIYIYKNTSEATPTLFMLDIAGIRVASGKHNQYFANFRKTYSAGTEPGDSDPLFNGDGVIYKNNDVRSGFAWQTVQVYIRKMLFDNAIQYDPASVAAWDSPVNVQDIFAENTVNGFNFNLAQVLSYYDSLKMNYYEINKIFPLSINVEDGFIFDNKEEETVLEIRFVIKNFVKKYEYEFDDEDGNRKLRHFYALSDWLRDIKRDEPAVTSDTFGKMGGNLLAVARSYVPRKTARIQWELGSNSAPVNSYVIAIKSGINNYSRNLIPNYTRPGAPYDEPKKPRVPITTFITSSPTGTSDYIEALLQYYLQYEVYKEQYDDFFDSVSAGTYETEWNDYEAAVSSLKIPQLATWSSDGTYLFEYVPAGTYLIYASNTGVQAGDLPGSFPNYLGSVTITNADFGGEVSAP